MKMRLVIILLCLFLLCLPALADFKRDYGRALKDIQNGDHQRAIELLTQAIAENPESAERVRIYGMRFEPYLPHYYLGQAYLAAGDCNLAIAAFDESLNKQIIQNTDLNSTLAQARQQCQGRTVDYSALADKAKASQARMKKALTDLQQFGNSKPAAAILNSNNSWNQTLDSAKQTDSDFNRLLDFAVQQQDADAISNLEQQANNLADSLQQILQNSKTQLAAVNEREKSQQAERLAAAKRQLVQTVASIRALAPDSTNDTQIKQLRSQLSDYVRQADNTSNSSILADVQTLNRNMSDTLRGYRSRLQEHQAQQQAIARKTPPEGLKRIAEAYFSGQYTEVSQLAKPESFQEPRFKIQALLFRAAARFNDYQLTVDASETQLDSCRSDIIQIKQIDPQFTPYLAAFSPRFIELFEQTRR